MDTLQQAKAWSRDGWRRGIAWWHGRPRWLRRALWTALLAWGGYLVLGNLFLNTLLHPLANRRPEAFQAQWGVAHTLFPGYVSARQVRLQGQVRDLAWDVQADHVAGRIALWPLLRRELRVPSVVARNVGGGVRHVDRARPAPAPRAGGWTLLFERIASDSVREGHYDGLVLEGNGSASFGFSKQLRGGPIQVLDSSVHFDGARLRAGPHTLLDGATLDGAFSIARHTHAEALGLRTLLLTDAALGLDAEGASLRGYVGPDGRFRVGLVPGGGRLHGRLVVDDGVLQPGGRLAWTAPVRGTGVAGDVLDDTLNVDVQVDDDIGLRLRVPGREGGSLDLDAELRLQGRQLPVQGTLAGLLPRASGHVAGRWHFPSLGWVAPLFNAPSWFELEGAGELRADLRVEGGRVAPGSHVELPEVAAVATVMGTVVSGRGRVLAELGSGDGGALQTRMEAALDGYAIAAADAPQAPFARGDNLRLDVVVDGMPARGEGLAATTARLRFSDAVVPDLRVYNRFLSGQMRIERGRGSASADLQLDGRGNLGQGKASVQGRDARMSFAGRQLRGDLGIDARLRRADLEQRRFDLDGSQVRLRDVSFRDAAGRTRQGWWADVDLPEARIDLPAASPALVHGRVGAQARDAGFLLDLFGGTDRPRWMERLVDSGKARAEGRVRWQGDTLVLDGVHARNDRYDVHARLELSDGQHRGQLLASMGPLSAGLGLQGDHHQWHLLRAREWFEGHPPLLH
ncbi:hypothetical protein [Pseudoxanthomonas sp. J35]|uniref:hypothetical protein n=1 Tax=Pseudoxanthomonas sp. J35 TaxID=935852 RepID=UPI000684D7E4|nr:hypothetical protein [Pseudoxanthomonas sp. J35]